MKLLRRLRRTPEEQFFLHSIYQRYDVDEMLHTLRMGCASSEDMLHWFDSDIRNGRASNQYRMKFTADITQFNPTDRVLYVRADHNAMNVCDLGILRRCIAEMERRGDVSPGAEIEGFGTLWYDKTRGSGGLRLGALATAEMLYTYWGWMPIRT